MRTLNLSRRWLTVSAAVTIACGGGNAPNPMGPTSVSPPSTNISGAWQGQVSESRVDPNAEFHEPSPGRTTRSGSIQLSLRQSGSQLTGGGEASGNAACIPQSFRVTGTVMDGSRGTTFTISFVGSDDPADMTQVDGVATSSQIDGTYSSPRPGCEDWAGNFSLVRP